MARKIGNLFTRLTAFANLTSAARKAMRGCGRTEETCRFFFHREAELLALKRELESGAYWPGSYRLFKVHDPKERDIAVAPFRDRVVHHAVVNILEPIYEPVFIYDSYATRKGKGTHRAVLRAQTFLRRWAWYYKADIRQYFASVDHEILLGLLARRIRDGRMMDLIGRIVRNAGGCRGLPIGNLTSQFLANVYLDPFDHHIKNDLGMKGYVRYMDDFVIFGDDPGRLDTVMIDASGYLEERLRLQLRDSCTYRNRAEHGLSYLGMRIHRGLIRIRPENRRRSLRRLSERLEQWRSGRIDDRTIQSSLTSIVGHLRYFCPTMPVQ